MKGEGGGREGVKEMCKGEGGGGERDRPGASMRLSAQENLHLYSFLFISFQVCSVHQNLQRSPHLAS